MRGKSLVLLALALGCGLVASVGISQVLDQKPKVEPESLETDSVLVALQDVEYGTPLTAQLVKLEAWPKDKIPTGAIMNIENIEGRRARSKLFSGEPILEAKLLGVDEVATASLQIPKGYRAFSVKVTASSTGGSLILPGDRVDVLVYVRTSNNGINEVSTQTILQDVKVFAVNQIYNKDNIDTDGTAITAKTVSLLVTPAQAEKIALAEELGKIRLSIRSPDDDLTADVSGAQLQSIFGNGEKSDRDNEEERPEEFASNSGASFLEWVRDKASDFAADLPAATGGDENSWTMILLAGNETQEVLFREGQALPTIVRRSRADSGGSGSSGDFGSSLLDGNRSRQQQLLEQLEGDGGDLLNGDDGSLQDQIDRLRETLGDDVLDPQSLFRIMRRRR